MGLLHPVRPAQGWTPVAEAQAFPATPFSPTITHRHSLPPPHLTHTPPHPPLTTSHTRAEPTDTPRTTSAPRPHHYQRTLGPIIGVARARECTPRHATLPARFAFARSPRSGSALARTTPSCRRRPSTLPAVGTHHPIRCPRIPFRESSPAKSAWAADIGLIARSSSDKIGEFADAFAYAVRATNRALDAQYGVRRPTPCPTYFALVGNAPQTQSVAACVAGRAPVSHTCGCSAAQPLAAVRIGAAQGRARKP